LGYLTQCCWSEEQRWCDQVADNATVSIMAVLVVKFQALDLNITLVKSWVISQCTVFTVKDVLVDPYPFLAYLTQCRWSEEQRWCNQVADNATVSVMAVQIVKFQGLNWCNKQQLDWCKILSDGVPICLEPLVKRKWCKFRGLCLHSMSVVLLPNARLDY
jgi:hypothetical protein